MTKNYKIKYLFIKNFSWQDIQSGHEVGGHPAAGRVYRSIFNQNDNSYGLVVEEFNTQVLLKTLNSTDETLGYLSAIEEISVGNILDLQPREEDLNSLNKWIETDNEDLKRRVDNSPVEMMPVLAILNRAMDDMEDQKVIAGEGAELLLHLYHLNSIHFQIIMDVVEELIEYNISDVDDISMTSYPTSNLAKSLNGMGYLLGKTYESLEAYANHEVTFNSNEKSGNIFPQYLLDAIVALVREKERRIIQELD